MWHTAVFLAPLWQEKDAEVSQGCKKKGKKKKLDELINRYFTSVFSVFPSRIDFFPVTFFFLLRGALHITEPLLQFIEWKGRVSTFINKRWMYVTIYLQFLPRSAFLAGSPSTRIAQSQPHLCLFRSKKKSQKFGRKNAVILPKGFYAWLKQRSWHLEKECVMLIIDSSNKPLTLRRQLLPVLLQTKHSRHAAATPLHASTLYMKYGWIRLKVGVGVHLLHQPESIGGILTVLEPYNPKSDGLV